MQKQGYIYNCPEPCPIKKHCFIIKTEAELIAPIAVLKKCEARKGKDIRVEIGGEQDRARPP